MTEKKWNYKEHLQEESEWLILNEQVELAMIYRGPLEEVMEYMDEGYTLWEKREV